MRERLFYRKATEADCAALTRLGQKLWPDHSYAELYEEFAAIVTDPNAAVILCIDGDTAAGFAHCQLRFDYVEGTSTSPAGFLEGIFVEAPYRKQGVAREMLRLCEAFARERGCTEFGSDCELWNEDSLSFHLRVGFREVNRTISFAKKL